MSSWDWPLEDRNLGSETALRERERERDRERQRERERERQRETEREREREIETDRNLASVTALPERERQEPGFGNSTASALAGEDLRPGGGGVELGRVCGRGG